MSDPMNDTAPIIPETDAVPEVEKDEKKLSSQESDVLSRVYWERRINYQLGYYQDRTKHYEEHIEASFKVNAILMTTSTLIASIGALTVSEIWSPLIALITAIIPAIAAFIAAFRQLYNWDNAIILYRNTELNLESAKLLLPDYRMLTPTDAHKSFPELVSAVESAIGQEIKQWDEGEQNN